MPWVAPAIMAASAATGAASQAGLFGGKGGGTDTSWQSSPQQLTLANLITPFIERLTHYGVWQGTEGTWSDVPSENLGAPRMGAAPQMTQGPKMPQGPAMYNIPSIQNMLPSDNWYKNLSPEIKAGLYAPYEEQADVMTERLGSLGQLGSARPGGSGATGAAMGELYSQAAKDVPLSAWSMTQPAYQNQFNAQLNRNIAGYGTDLERWRQNYQTSSYMPWLQNYQTSLIPWEQNYQSALQAWQMPYQILPGLLGGTYPTGVVSPRGNMAAGAIGGLGTGAMAAMPYMNTGGKGGGSTQLPYIPAE